MPVKPLSKGRITNTVTGNSITFMLNPPDIADEKKVNWGSIEVPGASHPVYQYGSGGERTISFELYLDSDMATKGKAFRQSIDPLGFTTRDHDGVKFTDPGTRQFDKDGISYLGAKQPNFYSYRPERGPFDVREHVDFIQSLLYPNGYYDQGNVSTIFAAVSAPTLLLSIGNLYKRVPCILMSAPVKYKFFLADMTPTKATLSLKFCEIIDRSKTGSEIYNPNNYLSKDGI